MADIRLENMSFYAHHGCYAQEQLVGGRFRVDFSFRYDSLLAQQSDDISQTVNYLEVYELIRERMAVTSHLLEHVASGILDLVGQRFSLVEWAEVRVTKLAPPLGGQLGGVSVTLERSY
ncbi:MAG: dihydroneopterin aldolase [Rikenellaceae bacterium]